MVITRVDTAGPVEAPSSTVATTVAIDEAERFTTLLPIRMVDSIRSKSSAMRSASRAFSSPSSARFCMRMRLMQEYAVSDAEKNADSVSSRSRAK